MNVQIFVTRTDFCLPNLINQMHDLDVDFQVAYLEDHPNVVDSFNIRHSPNVFVDGLLAFRHQPTEQELRSLFPDRLLVAKIPQ